MSSNAADIVARIERLPHTGWHVKARVIVGIATFFDAYDSLTIAYVLPVVVGLWHIEQSQIGLLISAGNAGQLIGALTFGWIADRIGRLRALVLGIALFALGSLACAFAYDFTSLFTLRTIEGIGLGGEVPVAAAYIGEMAKARGRGFFFLIYEGIFGIGIFCAAFLGRWMVPNFGWQSMFILGAVPALIALVLRRMLPESARWLADKGRYDEAEKLVARIEAEPRKEALPPPRVTPHPAPRKTRLAELFAGIYARRTVLLWTQWAATFFVAYGYSIWLPTLYVRIGGMPVNNALLLTLVTWAATLTTMYLEAWLLEKVGRKPLFIFGFAMITLGGSFGATMVLFFHATGWQILFASALIMGLGTALNSSACVNYTAELYPTRMRGLGIATGSSMNRLASIFSPFAVGALLNAGYGIEAVFAMFAVAGLIGLVVLIALGVETKGRTLEELSP